MHNRFTFVIKRDGKWFIGSCPQVPGANGQGRTLKSCSRSLVQAINLLIDERHAD